MNSYKYYYLKVLRPDFLTKYSWKNINSVVKLDQIVVFFYLSNLDKEIDDGFLRAAFLLEYLVGQRSFLRGFKFKFKYDSSEVNFYCSVSLSGVRLFDFLSVLYLVLYRVRYRFKYNLVGNKYVLSFKAVKSFFNVGLLEEEYFQWNKYLNVCFVFSNFNIKSGVRRGFYRSIIKAFI